METNLLATIVSQTPVTGMEHSSAVHRWLPNSRESRLDTPVIGSSGPRKVKPATPATNVKCVPGTGVANNVDNWTTFWGRPGLIRSDAIHPTLHYQ